MSSCFFSSREKIRISFISDSKKRRKTALPKLPVPPVMSNTLSLKMLMICVYLTCLYSFGYIVGARCNSFNMLFASRLFVFYSIDHLTYYEQQSHDVFLGEGGSVGG